MTIDKIVSHEDMDDICNRAAELANAPLEEANLNPRLIRLLTRAGYKTLLQVFEEDEKEIQDITGRLFGEFTKLVDSYYEHPDRFVSAMLQERQRATPKQSQQTAKAAHKRTSKADPSTQVVRSQRATQNQKEIYISDSVLKTPFGQVLKEGQETAKKTFDNLCDRHETVLVYQAFPAFSIELDEIRDSFLHLFEAYAKHPERALAIAKEFLPDIFLLFVADLARDVYTDDNLWGNFFKVLPLSQKAQCELKETFVDILANRNMPLYCRDEAAYYYFYTTLLHGGLSKESWVDLWRSSLFPMAKALEDGEIGISGEISGFTILQQIKNTDARYAPNVTVMRILQKAPDATIAPLFESAMRVAVQARKKDESRDEYVLIDDSGLPEAAVVALHDYSEKKSESSSLINRSKKKQAVTKRKFVSLPSAELNLDLEKGTVLIKWPRKQYSDIFLGDRIDFYIDGEKCKEQYFETMLNKCILDDVEMEVPPQSRYDVEVRFLKRSDGEDGIEFIQKDTLKESFMRSKPGCFEFIRGADGVYRLRSRGDKITRPRRVAYILKKGYYIEPGSGMNSVSEYETAQAWKGTSVFVYDVEPGASGSIFKRAASGNDEEVAVWHESYSVHINKQSIIGETFEGRDLYGYISCKDGDNAGLPYIVIDASDSLKAFDDLEISCTCDGERVSVQKRILWEDGYGESKASQIGLSLKTSYGISWHAELVEIVGRQISTGGKLVFRYRFAVVPIQEFKLAEAHVENGIVVSQYSFHTCMNVFVTDANGNRELVNARGQYWKRTLLKDEFMPLVIASEDGARTVNAKLALAAIDISLPTELVELSNKRPLCLSDAITMGTSKGEIRVKALGWRYNRILIAALYKSNLITNPLFYKELKQPSDYAINIFANPSDYVPGKVGPEERRFALSVRYGNEYCDVKDSPSGFRLAESIVSLLNCSDGLGFKEFMLVPAGDNLVIKFDNPVLSDVQVLFKRVGRRTRNLAACSLKKGEQELLIPEDVAHEIRTHKKVAMTFAPKSRFGKPRSELSFDLPLRG